MVAFRTSSKELEQIRGLYWNRGLEWNYRTGKYQGSEINLRSSLIPKSDQTSGSLMYDRRGGNVRLSGFHEQKAIGRKTRTPVHHDREGDCIVEMWAAIKNVVLEVDRGRR